MSMVQRLLAKHEGSRTKAYKDSKGIWTIGVGHNLEANPIPQEAVNIIFEADLGAVLRDIHRAFPWFEDLDEVRQAVIIDVVFNMGLPRFRGFKNTIRAIEKGNYRKAAEELLDSKAARELPIRYDELAQMLLTGESHV